MRVQTKSRKRFFEPKKVPSGLVILIDSREQMPLGFKSVPIEYINLKAGDYSCKGFEKEGISLERKTITDFLLSISHNRKRFEKEIERLSKFEFAAILIEANFDGLIHPPIPQSRINPLAVLSTINKIEIEYHIPVNLVGRRQNCAEMVFNCLSLYFRKKRQGLELGKKE